MYTKGLPLKLRLELMMADKNGLFHGVSCPFCHRYNYVDYKKCKIKIDGIHYSCEWAYCDKGEDIIGMDIISNAANEYIDEHPWSLIGFIYLML